MRAVVAGVAVLVLGATVHAQPSEAVKQLSGYWKPESVLFDGKDQLPDANARAQLTLVIKGGEYRVYYCTNAAKDEHVRLFTADLTLDPAAKTFELAVKEGQKKGEKRQGIYEHKDGKLTICYGPSDKPRPTKFEAPAGSGYFCETWTFQKPLPKGTS